MSQLQSYPLLYPELPVEIVYFFRMESENGVVKKKTIMDFCNFYHAKYSPAEFPQPSVVAAICDILISNNSMSLLSKGGLDNTGNTYMTVIRDETVYSNPYTRQLWNRRLSYFIYGFKYIYGDNARYVLPVEYTDQKGDKALGSCFLYKGGIATAKHCIEGAKAIAIQGIAAGELSSATFDLHENKYMDLVFIRLKEQRVDSLVFSKEAEILDEVMAMGYPKIPGYHNFLTAENANVSARFTASVGHVASNAEDIFMRENLFLITARIRGGNSGGPIIAKDGSIVGVAANLAAGEGDYDDLGYGTVIPIKFMDQIIENPADHLSVSGIEFKEFLTD